MSRNHLASIVVASAFLFTEFGESFARAKFGDAKIDTLPRYVRGKHAGKLKGLVRWWRVERGGWVREQGYMGESAGHVENRVGKTIRAELCEAPWGAEPKPIAYWSLDDDRRTAELLERFRKYMASRDAREAEIVAARFGRAREEMTRRINRAHDPETDITLESNAVY